MKIRIHGLTIRPAIAAVSLVVLAFTLVSGMSTAHADAVSRAQAKRIHDRLTGVPPTTAILDQMEAMIDDPMQGAVAAANLAMDPARNPRAKYFYNVVLKNWITPWTNVDQTQFAPLNDYTATVIGMILKEDPFNQVLSANYLYTADIGKINTDLGLNIAQYSISNNNQYEQLENNNVDLSQYLVKSQQTSLNIPGASAGDSAGVITSRAAGEAFISAGTNRRMLRFTLKNFMCRDLEDVKDITRVPDRIRQDVTRSPGGDSSLFLNSCIGCHSGMDPLASAYSYYEWTAAADGSNGHLVYSGGGTNPATQAKYHINRTNFETGFITSNDGWKNYWRAGPNAALQWGWNWGTTVPPTNEGEGRGAKQLGQEIASSKAFAQCQVEKVYKQVCLQSPINQHATEIERITNDFPGYGTNGYSLKQVFAEVAAVCKGN